jgi:hypothetical protein
MQKTRSSGNRDLALLCLFLRRAYNTSVIVGLLQASAFAHTALIWQQIKEKFEAANPTLKAAQLDIDESRAAEITAYLRANPDFDSLYGRDSNLALPGSLAPVCRYSVLT